MKRIFGIKGLEKAEETARQLLWENNKRSGENFTTTEEIRTYRDGTREAKYMEDDETGNIVFFTTTPKDEENYILYFLEAQEADPKNFTFPFRSLEKDKILFPLMLGAMFFKPTREVTFDEAFSPEGAEAVLSYMEAGEMFYTFSSSREEAKEQLTKENAFGADEFEGEDGSIEERHLYMKSKPLPSILTELTGLPIKNAKDYAKGVESLIKRKLNKEERKEAEKVYRECLPVYFFVYLTYEFARTESYEHLKELSSRYKEAGLSEDWYEENSLFLDYMESYNTAEEQVLSRYLATWISSRLRTTPLREIGEHTGTPYDVLLKAAAKGGGHLWR